jgi:hypothetical protein
MVKIPIVCSALEKKFRCSERIAQKAIYDLYSRGQLSLEPGQLSEGKPLLDDDGNTYAYLSIYS